MLDRFSVFPPRVLKGSGFVKSDPDCHIYVYLSGCHALVVRAADRRIVPIHSAVQIMAMTITMGKSSAVALDITELAQRLQ